MNIFVRFFLQLSTWINSTSDEAPSRTSVYRWYGEFNRDHSSLQDKFREGRRKSVVVPETINAVCHCDLSQD